MVDSEPIFVRSGMLGQGQRFDVIELQLRNDRSPAVTVGAFSGRKKNSIRRTMVRCIG